METGGCTCGNPNCEWCGGWRQPDQVPMAEWMVKFKKLWWCEKHEKRIAELEAALDARRKESELKHHYQITLEQRIEALEADNEHYRHRYMTDVAPVKELEERIEALEAFVESCHSLTGSLWPQNETTEQLARQLALLPGKADD